MNPTELVAEALKLNPRSRAEVASRLLESLEDLSDAEVEALWLEEAERRDLAVDQGELTSAPAAQVFAGIRSRLG